MYNFNQNFEAGYLTRPGKVSVKNIYLKNAPKQK